MFGSFSVRYWAVDSQVDFQCHCFEHDGGRLCFWCCGSFCGWFLGQFCGQFAGQSFGQLLGQFFGQFLGQFFGQFAGQFSGQSLGQSAGQLLGQLAGPSLMIQVVVCAVLLHVQFRGSLVILVVLGFGVLACVALVLSQGSRLVLPLGLL